MSGSGSRSFRVTAYEHVGIRVTDRSAAIRFYEKLGWREDVDIPEHSANEMVNDAGVRINLIFNGERSAQGAVNVLQDKPHKYPGFTHGAFVVDNLQGLMATLEAEGITITEGPVQFEDRRCAVFIRDLDGNVLEFNEMAPSQSSTQI